MVPILWKQPTEWGFNLDGACSTLDSWSFCLVLCSLEEGIGDETEKETNADADGQQDMVKLTEVNICPLLFNLKC